MDIEVLDLNTLRSYVRLYSERELEMRLFVQGELCLWESLSSVWYVEDDGRVQSIMADMDMSMSNRFNLDVDDISYLRKEYGEYYHIFRDGWLYRLLGFYIFTSERVYFSQESRVLCVRRHP